MQSTTQSRQGFYTFVVLGIVTAIALATTSCATLGATDAAPRAGARELAQCRELLRRDGRFALAGFKHGIALQLTDLATGVSNSPLPLTELVVWRADHTVAARWHCNNYRLSIVDRIHGRARVAVLVAELSAARHRVEARRLGVVRELVLDDVATNPRKPAVRRSSESARAAVRPDAR